MQAVQSPKISFKEISIVSAGFLLLLAVWFWDLFTVKIGFLSGDHRVQHYPWMHYLYTELHAGRFPLWTGLIGCGFPIFAEGQIAALYPLNLLIYGLLPIPFDVAYNYSTILHYLIGGILFYVYTRSLGVSQVGSFLGGLIYLFGSCQGGYFYNMNSQKTVIWFPLVLLMIEKFLRSRRLIWPFWIGFVFGIQVMAGYFQIAVYTVLFSMFYYLVRVLYEFKNERRTLARLSLGLLAPILMGLTALLTALPQLLATWELAQFSSRQNLPESFAYVGSLPPQGFLTLLFPFLDPFLGQEMYAGIFGLFLVIVAFCHWRAWSVPFKTLFWLMIFTVLIALGGFSPLYVSFVKLTHFYGFRVPAKTVFFLGFILAVLAGYGWDRTLGSGDNRFNKAARIFLIVVLVALGFALSGELLIKPLIPLFKNFGAWILGKYYVGSPLHPYSTEVYSAKLDGFLAGFLRQCSLTQSFWMRWWAVLLGAGVVISTGLLFFPIKFRRFFLVVGLVLLALDLYGYNDVNNTRSAFESYHGYFKTAEETVSVLKRDTGDYRIYEYYANLTDDGRFPILYNQNMAYGLSDIGVYSPFAPRFHRDYFTGLGANSDSLTVSLADPAKLRELKPLLDYVGVKYLLGLQKPEGSGWERIWERDGLMIFKNREAMPRAFWLAREPARLDQPFEPAVRKIYRTAEVYELEPSRIKIKVFAPESGFLYLSNIDYPGWKAYVDGRETEILKANGIFMAVGLRPGERAVEFRYQPAYEKLLGIPALLAGFLFLFSFIKTKDSYAA